MVFGEDHCADVRAPFGLSIFTSVVTSLLTIITLPGNLLICIAILKDPNKELKTSFNYLLLNMAIADLVVGAITDPIFILFHIREALGYTVITWYALPHMSFFISCTASLLSIAALAIERCITVTARYRQRMRPTRAVKFSIVIWFISISLPCLYFQIGFFRFAFFFAIATVFFTLVIIFVAFYRIYGTVSQSSRQIGQLQCITSRAEAKRTEYERRVTRGFLAILLFYTLCNIPACVFILIINLCENCNCIFIHYLRDIFLALVLINCSGNQFIYAWRMKTFTRAFRRFAKHDISEGSMQSTLKIPDLSTTERQRRPTCTPVHDEAAESDATTIDTAHASLNDTARSP